LAPESVLWVEVSIVAILEPVDPKNIIGYRNYRFKFVKNY